MNVTSEGLGSRSLAALLMSAASVAIATGSPHIPSSYDIMLGHKALIVDCLVKKGTRQTTRCGAVRAPAGTNVI